MRWYDRIFGGRKNFYALVAAMLGFTAFLRIPQADTLKALPALFTFLVACLITANASNVIQKIKLNGGANGQGTEKH